MSVKFRNPKTGEVYDLAKEDCVINGFCREYDCCNCQIYEHWNNESDHPCADWANSHPHEAAKLMGYEVVEDDAPHINWDKITPGTVVQCKTEAEAEMFLGAAEKLCYKWISGALPTAHTFWKRHRENTGYEILSNREICFWNISRCDRDIIQCTDLFGQPGKTCFSCKHYKGDSTCDLCGMTVKIAPEEGCSVWKPKEENEVNQSEKTHICEVLGVEVNQRFRVDAFPFDAAVLFHVDCDGEVKGQKGESVTGSVLRCIIENRDHIIRKPCWKEEEIQLAKTFLQYCVPDEETVILRRKQNRQLTWKCDKDDEESLLPFRMFPSLKRGTSVDMLEIAEAGVSND